MDNLRSFAMLFGIFVHTTTLGDFGWLEAIPIMSHHFRMGTFFAISGFFAVMLLLKRGVIGFLRHRMRSLAIPFVAGVVILNPITLWVVYRLKNGPVSLLDLPEILAIAIGSDTQSEVIGTIVWHLHLWFLAVLLIYMIATPVMLPLIDKICRLAFLRRLLSRISPAWTPLAIAVGVAVAVVIMRAVSKLTLRPLDAPWIIEGMLLYWPYFLLGQVLYREPVIWERVHRLDPLLLLAALFFILLQGWVPEGGMPAKVIYSASLSLNACLSFFALLWLFRRHVDSSRPPLRLLSDATYSIYIFHYLVIYVLGTALIPIMGNGSVMLFIIISAGTFLGGIAIHVGLIARVPVLRLLFNGRLLPQQRVKSAA